ncbi:MAG: phosphoribosylformylglycinamidine synthase subunit PurQ [Deltaproteobacteria bacterium]|nr:phosphoribosylformylglycinamidine synthase subunit PurQ [Deltaproteobacteria bacterium]
MKTLILSGYGTNCEDETAYACRKTGGGPVEVRHMSDLYTGGISLDGIHLIVFGGGFLDGDDLGSGRAASNRFRWRPMPQGTTFLEELEGFIRSGRLVLAICNGFQLLVKLGLLPGTSSETIQTVSLAPNGRGRFEDRWVRLKADPQSPCVFTRGVDQLDLPVRHGEGRLAARQGDLIPSLVTNGLAPLRYCDGDGNPTEDYPQNPNGSPLGVAALCNPAGTVMGLMPHPEAFNHYTNHPQWTRLSKTGENGDGLVLFDNAYRHLKEHFQE